MAREFILSKIIKVQKKETFSPVKAHRSDCII